MDVIFPELDKQAIASQVYKWVSDEWLNENKPGVIKKVRNWFK
jgi:hypothetical protein